MLKKTGLLCITVSASLVLFPAASLSKTDDAKDAVATTINEKLKKEEAEQLRLQALDLIHSDKFDDAEQVLVEALQLHKKVLGAKHPDTVAVLFYYAIVLELLDRKKEAEPRYAEAFQLRREVLGSKHPDTVISLFRYTILLENQGREKEAETVLPGIDRARLFHGLAVQQEKSYKTDESWFLYKAALRLRREALGAKHPDTLASLNNYAKTLITEKEAEPLFAEALKLRREVLGAKHPDTLTSLGYYAVALNFQGRTKEAEPLFAEAFRLRREVLGAFHGDTLGSRMGYSTVLESLGHIKEAEEVLNGDGRKVDRALMLQEQASKQHQAGNYRDAEPLYAEALLLRREVLGAKHLDTLKSLNDYGILLVSLGRAEEAEPLQAEAVRLYREVRGQKHPDTLASLNNYGRVLTALNRLKEAELIQAEALQGLKETLGAKNIRTLLSLGNYAVTIHLQGRAREAEPLYAEALRLNREVLGARHPLTLLSLSHYAGVLSSLDRAEEAEPLYSEVLQVNQEALGEKYPDWQKQLKDLASVRLELPASSYLAIEPAKAWLAAVRNIRETTGFTPASQSQLEREEQKSNIAYQIFADAAWARGPGLTAEARESGALPLGVDEQALLREEAFLSLQDSLTNAAGKAISATVARKAAGSMESLVIEREMLLEQWVETDKELIKVFGENHQSSNDKRAELRARLAELEAQMGAIDNRLRKDAPDYFSLIRPVPLSLVAAQKVLAPDEAALMTVPTNHGTHIILASDEGLRWVRSDWNTGKIDIAVKRLLWDVGADVDESAVETVEWSEEGSGAYPFAFDPAYALYRELIAPIADGLKGKKHVFISASGSLSSLPFGLLVSEIPAGEYGDPAVLRNAKWFADDHALIQIPTLQSLEFLRKYRTSGGAAAKLPFLGIGDPVLAGKSQARGNRRSRENSEKSNGAFKRLFRKAQTRGETAIADVSELRNMARLPGTAIELTAIWEEFGKPQNALYLADQATEDFVRTQSLDANIIVFATHGLLAGEINGAAEPGLVLTPPSQANESNDGYLSTSEISALKLNADWVILSACNTAAGDGGEGAPGLSGLARSFFYAGARNLLASHWPVRDDVAAQLTVRTISIAKKDKKLSRAQAFQHAMREIRNDKNADSNNDTWAHPSAWAPFSLIGDGAN